MGRCGTGCFPLTAARRKVQPERQSPGSRTAWRVLERTGDAMDTVTGLRPLPDQSQDHSCPGQNSMKILTGPTDRVGRQKLVTWVQDPLYLSPKLSPNVTASSDGSCFRGEESGLIVK